MSTKRARFPSRRPADQPPPLEGEIVDGRRTPAYVLAWVCDITTFYRNLGGGTLGEVDDCNFMDVVSDKWGEIGFGYALAPMAYPGPDGNFYLIAMFNTSRADHLTRARNVTQDPLIQAARISMRVDLDSSLENTLMWYRWPLHWLHAEEREKERLAQLQSELAQDSIQ
ncbi:hypothetical protein B0H12DRAFT_1324622 [Mycena haematopus]|nr:hypothetical protein B0H12DRAFT_1324622 [Mycena haematopus]